MRILITVIVATLSVACFADKPGAVEKPQTVVMSPDNPSGLKGRSIDFSPPSVVIKQTQGELPSIGKAIGGILYLPVWAINKTLDLAAGTVNVGGQVLSIGAGAGIDVLEAGSRGIMFSSEAIETGAENLVDGTNRAVN